MRKDNKSAGVKANEGNVMRKSAENVSPAANEKWLKEPGARGGVEVGKGKRDSVGKG